MRVTEAIHRLYMGVSQKMGYLLRVLYKDYKYFGVYIGVPFFWETTIWRGYRVI